MALGGEPKNGDYARYVEELSRSGASACPVRLRLKRRGLPARHPAARPRRRARCRPRPGAMAARRPRRSPLPPHNQIATPRWPRPPPSAASAADGGRDGGRPDRGAHRAAGAEQPAGRTGRFHARGVPGLLRLHAVQAADARKPGKPPAGKLPPLKSTYRTAAAARPGASPAGMAPPMRPAGCRRPDTASQMRMRRLPASARARPVQHPEC